MAHAFIETKYALLRIFLDTFTKHADTFPEDMVGRLADNGKNDPEFMVYLGKRGAEDTGFDTATWVGRYVVVEPSHNNHIRISFMEAIAGQATDFGPGICADQVDVLLGEFVINYLITGVIPNEATTKH